MSQKERCSNCKHCKYQQGEFVCTNANSENYSLETDYNDSCDEWEER